MRDEIIQTALQQFLAEGIRSMTMQRLAAGMGKSTKTLYKYFADKEQLLEECLKLHYAEIEISLPAMWREAANPVAFVCGMYARSAELDFGANHLFYHDLNYYYPELQDKVIAIYIGRIRAVTDEAFRQAVAEGYFLPQLNLEVVQKTFSVLYTAVTRYGTYQEFGLQPQDILKHTLDVYLRGICTEKGLGIIDRIKGIHS